MLVDAIEVGVRHRRDMGDVEGLARSERSGHRWLGGVQQYG